jgi:5-methylcytosine-specific restriction protein A
MNRKTAEFAVHAIADRVGLSVQGRIVPDADGAFCEFVPTDGHPSETFVVRFRLGWRSAEASFVAGNFAGPLIASMGKCSEEARQTFAAFANGIAARKVKLLMRVNGTEVAAGQPTKWPQDWSLLELSLKISPLVVEPSNEAQLEQLTLDLVVPLFGMMATLIGVEENELPTTGEMEGRPVQSLTTKYERKKVNREACIQLKGSRCSVCGFDFAESYGHLGIGYIEIHHTKSIASLGPDYRVNVATELEPLCANCHAMAHREEPPVSIERLRLMVGERRKAKSV